jgi:hypothetical protein
MSSITKALPTPADNFSTTLSSGVTNTGLSIPLNSVTNLPTEGVGVIYQKNSDGTPVVSSIEFIHWTNISGSNLTLTDTGDRGLTGSYNAAQAHSSGDTFECWVHSSYHFKVWAAVEHNTDGTHAAMTATSLVASSYIQNTGSASPTPTTAGRLTWDTSAKVWKFGDGSSTLSLVDLTTAQTLSSKTLTSPKINVGSDAQGDIYYRDSGGNLARLAPGTAGNVLTSGGPAANPSWGSAASSTGALQSVQTSSTAVNNSNNTSTYSTACSVTWTPSAAADIVVFGSLNWYASTNNDQAKMRITLDTVAMGSGDSAYTDFPTSSKATTVTAMEYSSNLAASSHTVALQFAQNVGSGGININLRFLRVLVFNH